MLDGFETSYRDDWAAKHFLHPKTLRKAREVRTQLLDIMKHQKLDIIPCGTDWDVIRFVLEQGGHGEGLAVRLST